MSRIYGYPNDDCHNDPYPPRPCPVCRGLRGPRGIQGLPGVPSTNANAVIYYLDAANENTQTIELGNQTHQLLFNESNINGTSITRTGNTITLAAGTYFIELSTYALIPELAAGESLLLNVFLTHSGIPVNPSTQSIPVYSQTAQHIYIPTILETAGTVLNVNAIITSSIPATTAVDEIEFINTVLTIIRLGNNTPV